MTATTHRTRIMWIAAVVALLAMAAIAAAMWPSRAVAADKGATTLEMQAPKVAATGAVILSAKLTGPDGKPVTNANVDFLFQVDVLGQTEALLGRSQTTAAGTATWVYRVQQDGPVNFFARFRGDSTFAASTAEVLRYDVTGAPVPAVIEASRVRLVGQWVPWAALALVLSVWAMLIGVAVRTVVAIPAATRGFVPEPAGGDEPTPAWQSVSDLETN